MLPNIIFFSRRSFACGRYRSYEMSLYADNAATTPMSRAAIDAMLPFLDQVYGNPSSLHEVGQRAAAALLQARESIAASLSCSAKEIYFTSGGSEADNWAIRSAAYTGKAAGKCHLITSAIEHPAVLKTCQTLSHSEGFSLTVLPVQENGTVRPSDLLSALRPDTALVSVMYANHEIGTIEPVSELASVCREHGVLFHTDAVQAAGHLALDLSALRPDYLSLSAHKFHGPKGIGVLYARRGAPLQSLITGGEQERGRRAGTENLPAIAAMAAALKEACTALPAYQGNMLPLRNLLRELLLQIPGSHLNGDPVHALPGIVSVSFEGIDSETLLLLLSARGICVSAGSACASGSLEPSHVILALGRTPALARGTLRLSPGTDFTEEDIRSLAQNVSDCVRSLRGS